MKRLSLVLIFLVCSSHAQSREVPPEGSNRSDNKCLNQIIMIEKSTNAEKYFIVVGETYIEYFASCHKLVLDKLKEGKLTVPNLSSEANSWQKGTAAAELCRKTPVKQVCSGSL
jgi:hypothetical protein